MPGLLHNLIDRKPSYNKIQENEYFNYFWLSFYDIAMSMFKWENLPDSVDEHFMEQMLFDNARFAFYLDPDTGKIYSLNANGASDIDMYGYPNKYHLTSKSGGVYNKTVDADDVVICYNNKIRMSTFEILFSPSVRLANLAMTIDTNVNATKTPIIIEADVNSINSLKKLYADYVRNEPVLFARSSKNSLMDKEVLKAHNTGVEFYADRLLQLQHDLENDTLTRLGINNTNIQKKERLVSNEVDSNLMEIMSHAYSMLDSRIKFCELANEKYGLDITVDFRNKKEIDNILNDNINIDYDEERSDDYE